MGGQDHFITSVSIGGFKCLRSVSTTLAPLTVLIGKNDTGKSSFLEAIAHLCGAWGHDAGSSGLRHEFSEWRHVAGGHGIKATRSDGQAFSNALENTWKGPHPGVRVQPPYRLELNRLRGTASPGALRGQPLPFNGEALVDVLDRMNRRRFVQMEEVFTDRLPAFSACELQTADGGPMKEIVFRLAHSPDRLLHCRHASDGAMLVLAYLAIAYEDQPPSHLLIEEPENGVHPGQLRFIVELLHELTQRDINPVQVILSTHSPYLLDYVPADCVRVFTRRGDGDVKVSPLADIPGVKRLLEQGATPGEIFGNMDLDDLVQQESTHAGDAAQ